MIEFSFQMGPVFIHQESDYETFHVFFSYVAGQLAQTKMKLKGIEVTYDRTFFGTDEEKAMVLALESTFPSSPIVFCTRHIKKNVRNHLEKKTNRKMANKIIDAIWNDKDCLLNSSKKNFEKRKETFVETYQEYFTDTYLNRLLDRLENNVLNPSLLIDMITTSWTNNDGMHFLYLRSSTLGWRVRFFQG